MFLDDSHAIFRIVVIHVALAAFPLSVRAAERVTLRNGFEMRCDHHAEVEGRARLYLSAGEDSYIEFRTEEMAAVEALPDPPPAETQTQASRPFSQSTQNGTEHTLHRRSLYRRRRSSPKQTWMRCSARPVRRTTWT